MIQFPKKTKILFKPSRYKVLYGGRGSGKSWSVARALLLLGSSKPLRVLCARETQKSIADSVHKLLSDQIRDIDGLEDFYEVQKSIIKGANGTEFVFSGLKDAASLKSFEGMDICWVEEAQVVSHDSWEKLIPTVRKEGSEIWITFNPEFEDDATYERFIINKPDDCLAVKMNYMDNPWFPKVLMAEIEALKKINYNTYLHVWEGECVMGGEGVVYNLDKFGRYDRIAEYEKIVLSLDTAYKADQHNDPSCFIAFGCTRTHDDVIDCLNERMEYPQLRRSILEWCGKYKPAAVLIEDKASGQSLIQELRHQTNIPVIAIKPNGDKLTRAHTSTHYIESQRVRLPKQATWLHELEKQLISFPNSKHDDIIDALSQFINWRTTGTDDDYLAMMDRLYGKRNK